MRPPQCPVIGTALPPQLMRPFTIIAFDWDGTAVMNRCEGDGAVRATIERLLELGVLVVVITGTNFSNVDRQLSAAIRGLHKRNLFITTNRGSKVYGFDDQPRPVLLWQRLNAPEENRLLTVIADAVRDTLVVRTGLQIRVIYNRLNRRKIDLIPLPEWSDPPKSAMGDLLRAVEARLRGVGLAGGLREVVDLAERLAREKGLKDARITSDVKHVEVGITDKSDAVDWMMRELAQKGAFLGRRSLSPATSSAPLPASRGATRGWSRRRREELKSSPWVPSPAASPRR